jgi:CheY-like chemotaxis protein/predicted regulator of Ras-like GTPase activity (Roadblock/LC7/MglB family)
MMTQPCLSPEKHILVVDDEPSLVSFLSRSLKRLGDDYVIDTAQHPHEALEKIEKNQYQLLLTDYMMPDMSGLDLIQAAREVSPATQYVLMSAHITDQVRHKAGALEIMDYISKPFTTNQIRELVQRGVARCQRQVEPAEPARVVAPTVESQLKKLQVNAGAQAVLLLSNAGNIVQMVGQTGGVNRQKIASLVAANFLGATELANLLGSQDSDFKSSYQEGSNHNIYAYAVNKNRLLAVVFDARIKPGVVWFYTKQVAEALLPLTELAAADMAAPNPGLIEQLMGEINRPGLPGVKHHATGQFDPDAGSESQLEAELDQGAPSPEALKATEMFEGVEPTLPPTQKRRKKRRYKRLSFEEAVAAGLVPQHILSREEKSSCLPPA